MRRKIGLAGAMVVLCSACGQTESPAATSSTVSGAEQQTAGSTEAPPLDLSKESIQAAAESAEAEIAEQALTEPEAALPDLFGEKKDKNVKVSGNVLTKEEAESLQDSVDGVELKLEMKTK